LRSACLPLWLCPQDASMLYAPPPLAVLWKWNSVWQPCVGADGGLAVLASMLLASGGLK
jgi:hypothetical protein